MTDAQNRYDVYRAFGADPDYLQSLALLAHYTPILHMLGVRARRRWFEDWDGNDGERGPSCWIAPKGMVYAIGHANHNYFADLCGVEGTYELECAGWLHVSGGRADEMFELTSAQRKAIEQLNIRYAGKGTVRVNNCREYHRSDKRADPSGILKQLNRVPREYTWDAPYNIPHDEFWTDVPEPVSEPCTAPLPTTYALAASPLVTADYAALEQRILTTSAIPPCPSGFVDPYDGTKTGRFVNSF